MSVLVADASAVVELVRGDPHALIELGDPLARRRPVVAPELLDVEVAHAFRRYAILGELAPADGAELITLALGLPIRRVSHRALIPRAFDLRDNVTIYDAVYLALAESVGGVLVTADARLRDVPGVDATVTLLAPPT